ncbi:hypothetical protein I7X12_11210 [Halosimplex litoreum]|uniref:Uncharacterized protein n=1 Tax=Halosimplex litoreum TaxID=1198301 RepID=A0A7T3FV96_9EURY|nr:DUF5810 domain-containing protein [Halosimplex litoreum]QPV61338.1 hypothetical protein I7X12_11210 [Halosimplex litoreum]
MGYACPVCGDPQTDAEHLANHLAFTAMLRGGDHEAWLDDRIDGWAAMDPPELAEHVVDHAEEAEFPQVFEDTTGGHDHGGGHQHDHGSGHQHGDGHGHQYGGGRASGTPDAVESAAPGGVADLDDFEGETDDVLAEAKELTRRRRENAGGDGGTDDGDAEDATETGADGDETGNS